MSIESLMEDVADALPEMSRRGTKTVREVCLCYGNGEWEVMAGGHSAVHIGEWGGDFRGEGNTAEAALLSCLDRIKRHKAAA